ncbi:MAG: VWA domain-containing protein [Deltaproteobacteria bacterium]|nr:VWA domain-containing protein [Deltaproteobacteria bacterium]
MLTRLTTRLMRTIAIANLAALASGGLPACSQAEFGGKDKTAASGKAAKGKSKGDEGNLGGLGGPGVDASAYGTPVTDDLGRPGWVDDKIKSLVDTLFRTGAIPSLGDNPGNGGGSGTSSSSGIPKLGEQGNPGSGGSSGSGDGTGSGGSEDGQGKGPSSLFSDASGVLWMPCRDSAAGNGNFSSDFFAKVGAKVRVAGEFCPQAKIGGDVTVLYVIDHSGSMEGAGEEGPNDPTSNGLCGRFKAAEVIAKKFASMPDTKVQTGVIGFSGAARVDLQLGSLDALNAVVDKSKLFCGSDPSNASTNYHAAFTEAKKLIEKVPGKKIVYFISDGSPTTGPNNPSTSGLAAAQALRQIPDLTLFALFVGYTKGKANNPQGYLEQITGNPKAVRVTANATELVQAAAALAQPLVTIAPSDVVAQVTSGQSTVPVKIEKIEARKDAINRFIWVTEPFELKGVAGKSSINELQVTAKTSTGDSVKSGAEINFNAN